MDTGKGYFERYRSMKDLIEENPDKFNLKDVSSMNEDMMNHLTRNADGIFREGEILEIKGSRFEVTKIINNGLKLKLLPK